MENTQSTSISKIHYYHNLKKIVRSKNVIRRIQYYFLIDNYEYHLFSTVIIGYYNFFDFHLFAHPWIGMLVASFIHWVTTKLYNISFAIIS